MTSKFIWNSVGVGISGLCALHCLVVPIFVSLLPLYPMAEHIHEWTHPVLLVIIFPTVFFSIRSGRASRFAAVMLLLGVAILLLAWGLHDWFGQRGESLVTLAGSMTLISGHWLAYRKHTSRSCSAAENVNSK